MCLVIGVLLRPGAPFSVEEAAASFVMFDAAGVVGKGRLGLPSEVQPFCREDIQVRQPSPLAPICSCGSHETLPACSYLLLWLA